MGKVLEIDRVVLADKKIHGVVLVAHQAAFFVNGVDDLLKGQLADGSVAAYFEVLGDTAEVLKPHEPYAPAGKGAVVLDEGPFATFSRIARSRCGLDNAVRNFQAAKWPRREKRFQFHGVGGVVGVLGIYLALPGLPVVPCGREILLVGVVRCRIWLRRTAGKNCSAGESGAEGGYGRSANERTARYICLVSHGLLLIGLHVRGIGRWCYSRNFPGGIHRIDHGKSDNSAISHCPCDWFDLRIRISWSIENLWGGWHGY